METSTQPSVPPTETPKPWLKWVLVVVLVALASAGATYVVLTTTQQRSPQQPIPQPAQTVACTQDARLCPDGSSVGRTGPNCEFSPCPTLFPSPTTINYEPIASKNFTGWKTYKNTGLGYSIQYLPTWELRENPANGCGPTFWAPNKLPVWFTICPAGGKTLEDVSDSYRSNDMLARKYILLSERKGLILETKESINDKYIIDATLRNTTDNANEISIEFFAFEKSNYENNKGTFDQILSTFNFD